MCGCREGKTDWRIAITGVTGVRENEIAIAELRDGRDCDLGPKVWRWKWGWTVRSLTWWEGCKSQRGPVLSCPFKMAL